MALGQTITPPGGAIAGLNQSNTQRVTSTITGPPPQGAQPVTQPPQPTYQAPPATFTPPTNLATQQVGPDISSLQGYRQALIEQLFSHDQNLAAQFADPNNPNYIANPSQRASVAQMPAQADTGLLNTMNQIINSSVTKQKLTPAEQKQNYLQQLTDAITQDQGQTPPEAIIAAYRPYLSANDIIDTYNANVSQPLSYSQMSQMGYKPPGQLNKAAQQYSAASTALAAISALDEQSKAARRSWAGIYQNPLIAGIAQYVDPTPIRYQTARQSQALDLTKALLGLSYPGGANMMLGNVPNAWDSEEVRAGKIAALYQMAQSRMDEAQNQAGNIALGGSTIPSNMAFRPQSAPPVATAPSPMAQAAPSYQTSTGGYRIIENPSTTAYSQ